MALASCTSSLTPTPASANGTANMDPSQWIFAFSPGMPAHPGASGAGWQFLFPTQNGVHYLTTAQRPSSASQAITATISVSVNGAPAFEYRTAPDNVCDAPATVRLFFQRQGDDMSGQGQYEFYRWWSDQAFYVLGPGTITLTGDLTDPSQWSSVYGRHGDENPTMFRDALANVGNLGFTFGGGCFYGHGVYVDPGTGQATFKAVDYTIR
jgi:hypothetical protein